MLFCWITLSCMVLKIVALRDLVPVLSAKKSCLPLLGIYPPNYPLLAKMPLKWPFWVYIFRTAHQILMIFAQMLEMVALSDLAQCCVLENSRLLRRGDLPQKMPFLAKTFFLVPRSAVGTYGLAFVRASVRKRSQNLFIGFFLFLVQSWGFLMRRKWHFRILPKKSCLARFGSI